MDKKNENARSTSIKDGLQNYSGKEGWPRTVDTRVYLRGL